MANYDLAFPGAAIDAILTTAYDLQNAGYIFKGSATNWSGTPTQRTWLLAPAGFSGYGFSSAIPKGSIGICKYNGSSWSGDLINVVSIDSTVTNGSTNPVSGDAVWDAMDELASGIIGTLQSFAVTDSTPSANQETQIRFDVNMTDGHGVQHLVDQFGILSATASKAGLMSAADKAKVDAFLDNLRSLSFTDTTAAGSQGTQLVETLKATIGGTQETITALTILAATTTKAGLMSATDKAYIDGLPTSLSTISSAISNLLAMLGYYECSTAAGTAAKTVSASGYVLTTGGCIRIKMTNANTANNATLNINSTGAKALYYDGAQASSSNSWEAGDVLEVYYDGTQYQCASGGGGKFASGEKVKEVSLLNQLDNSGNIPKSSAVMDFLEPMIIEDEHNISYTNEVSGVQISNGMWISQQYRHLYIEPYTHKKGDMLVIKGHATNGSYFAFLTSNAHTVDTAVSFAISGQTDWTNVPADTEMSFAIPSNCQYIAINHHYGERNITYFNPSVLKVYNASVADIDALIEDIDEAKVNIEQLGERCVQQGETIQQTVYASIGAWQPNTGEIVTTFLKRANLKLLVKGYDYLTVTIPEGYYAQFYYVNDDNISLGTVTGSLDWYVGTKELEINGEHDIMLNIKYGSAGDTDITQEMLANLGWETEKSVSVGYAPAAPYSEVATINDILYGETERVPASAFQQGTNDASGNIVNSTTRLITTNLISIDDNGIVNITANGQKYVILTYSTDDVYETTSGWITEDGEYTFPSAKKVRFLVAKLNNTTITVSELAVVYEITTNIGLIKEVENLEKGASASEVKGNDSFNMFNKRVVLYNPYKDKPSNVFKGQMHCHTTNSDGADSPTTVVQKYLAAGYDFIAITDHNYITPDPQVQGIVYLANSYEDTHNSAGYQHMCVWNAQEVLNYVSMYQTTNTPQTIVSHFVKNGNSVVSYNHPEYPVVYASDAELESLPNGISIVEIFNGTIQTLIGTVATVADLPTEAYYGDMYDCTGNGKRYINDSTTYASPNWTETTASAKPDGNLDRGFRIMLDKGHKVFCNAVDDYHRGDNMFNRGWMMVYANSKTKESIWNALLNGCSYASAGVVLTDVNVKDGFISLQIENGESAVTTFYGENNTVLATVSGSSASYQIQGTEKYVRAMVQIGRFKAWTQPVWVIDVVNQYDF